jgi:tRNA threonylcarbamoyladenosine biosynthesis protein TsaB
MIDARRMEVFTALYNQSLQEVSPSINLILDESSFAEWLQQNTISFFGNGSIKAATVIQHTNASFISVTAGAANMVLLSAKKFFLREFADLAYSEPYYGKDFHSPISKKFY